MPILIPALVVAAVAVVTVLINRSNSKELIDNLTKEHVIVRLPKAYLWIGCCGAGLFCGFMLFAWLSSESIGVWGHAVFSFFALLSLFLTYGAIAIRLELFRNQGFFLIRTLAFRTHKVGYEDCISYAVSPNCLTLHTTNKRYHVDIHSTNFEYLLAELDKHKVQLVRSNIKGS